MNVFSKYLSPIFWWDRSVLLVLPHPQLSVGNMFLDGQKLPKLWLYWTLYMLCEELTCWKRLWCWEGLGAGGEGDDRGWDGWMTSLTRWTWVWVNSGSWWWTGRPGELQFMGLQRVGHDWATELNWTDICYVSSDTYTSMIKFNL